MLLIFSSMICIVMILSGLVLMWSFYSSRSFILNSREKNTSFECGFDGKKSFRSPFSFRFFYILMIFLMFDVELIFFMVLPLQQSKFFSFSLILLVSLLILFLGLIEEWRVGALNWKA